MAACAVGVSLLALSPASRATARPAPAAADTVPGEIIVRYTPGADTTARATVRDRANVSVVRDLLLPGAQLVHTLPGTAVSTALDVLNADPHVRYAEPNAIYRLLSTPNDPRFGDQWDLHNSGQTIQGVQGTPGADISAPAAWDVTTGSRNVKVAIIDTGTQYFHPDLAANMWQNPGEAAPPGEVRYGGDDDNNGFVDDLHGWDFVDNDADTTGTGEYGPHGTAVASLVGAVGDNGLGVTGVNRNVSLIALRVCLGVCVVSDLADAAVYAGQIGADVANMSFGGTGTRQALKDAIAAAPNTLFVAAAGNDGTDNDSNGIYPCSYELPNVICVTGTDNRDNQVFNYGATTVDLGAPALNVSTAWTGYHEVFSDDFEDMAAGWDYTQAPAPAVPGRWRRTLSSAGSVGADAFALEDSEGGSYANNADTTVTANAPIDLSGQRGCYLVLDAVLDTESGKDFLRVEAVSSLAGQFTELTRISGDTSGSAVPVSTSLNGFEGGNVYLRLRLTSGAQNTADGAEVDNVAVRCEAADSYTTVSGTSAASPLVAGAAALVKSAFPAATVAELRARILNSVDPIPSLAGKTVTGGRLNVAAALLLAPVVTIDSGPTGAVASRSASLAFSSEWGATFECRLDSGSFEPCGSPKGYSNLADGQHRFEVRARDRVGNLSEVAVREWTVDASAPAVAVDSGPANLERSDSASFAFSSEQGATFDCRLDDQPFAACSSPKHYDALGDGEHRFEVRARDEAGNVSAVVAYEWRIDTAAPGVVIDGGPSGVVSASSATFEFSSEQGAVFECRRDDEIFGPCSSPASYTGLADGAHRFEVRARDEAGNLSAVTGRDWTIDSAAPAVTISDAPASLTRSSVARFGFSAEAGSAFECRLDGGPFESCGSPTEFSDLPDGEHTFRVRATDAAGNTGAAATRSWTIDTAAPTVAISERPPSLTRSNSARIVFLASETGSTLECRLDGGSFGGCESPKEYEDLADGAHVFEVRATDAAGNLGQVASATWAVDTAAPTVTISDAPASPTRSNSARFAFSASEADSVFECRLDGGPLESCDSPKSYAGVADGAHRFEVRARDEAGHVSAVAAREWTIDSAAPVVTISDAPASLTRSSVARFAFSAEAGSVFECRLDGGPFESCGSPTELSDLPDGEHTFQVRATDAAGNTGAAATRSWTIDTVAPAVTISDAPASLTRSNSARFVFSASEADSAYECRLDDAAFAACGSPKSYTDLADGMHRFEVRASDEAGNVSVVAGREWTIDSAAPSVVIGTRPPALIASNVAHFEFAASEPGVALECRLDAGAREPCASPHDLESLPDGQHTFAVRATDAGGNVGEAAEATWTIDTTAPHVTITDGPPVSTDTRSATFTFDSSDADSVFECSLDSEEFAACSSPLAYDNLAPGTHTFAVSARDHAGNRSASPATRNWTITEQAADGNADDGGDSAGDPPPDPDADGDPESPEPTTTSSLDPGEPDQADLVAPRPDDPEPKAWTAPKVAVTIPHQTLTRVLSSGLTVRVLVEGKCPCRLAQTLRIDQRQAARLGSGSQSGPDRLGPVIARKQVRLRRAGQSSTTLHINRPAHKRLLRLRRIDGWLETSAKDRDGLVAIVRQRLTLRR